MRAARNGKTVESAFYSSLPARRGERVTILPFSPPALDRDHVKRYLRFVKTPELFLKKCLAHIINDSIALRYRNARVSDSISNTQCVP